jgi:hypothetical protein
LLLAAYLTCWWISYAGILRGLPRLPLVVWAGFDAGLRDLTAVVGWAALDLRFADLLAGLRTALGDAWVRLARNGLALGEGCSTVNEEGAIDWQPISPRTSITSRVNITAP